VTSQRRQAGSAAAVCSWTWNGRRNTVPIYTHNIFGDRSFAVAGPRVWNIASQQTYARRSPTRVSGVNLKRRFTGFLAAGEQCDLLPRNALKCICAVLGSHVVRPSVRLSVTLVICDHIGWKSRKLIARTISPTPSLLVAERRST